MNEDGNKGIKNLAELSLSFFLTINLFFIFYFFLRKRIDEMSPVILCAVTNVCN